VHILEPDPTPAANFKAGFFGVLARFAGGGAAEEWTYDTRITGGQTYVCGAYYQEAAHASFHFMQGSGGEVRAFQTINNYQLNTVRAFVC
jgi:hypothetical protein